MIQVHNKHLDVEYKGLNHDAIKKFSKTCDRRSTSVGIKLKKIRDPQLFIIRNKYTKEEVDLEELVSHTVSNRNWKGIAIALVVIIAVCSLIITTIILISPTVSDDKEIKPKITFEDFISGKYNPETFAFTWSSGDDAFFYRNHDGAAMKYNCSTNSSYIVIANSTFREVNASSFTISPDQLYALLPCKVEKIFRHSNKAYYKVYNIKTRHYESLEGPKGAQFQYVSWAPVGDGMVFVQYNNIFYKPNAFQHEAIQITHDGVMGEIFNGVPDWVYEEEVLSQDNAIWWSPNGKYFLYAVFNDTAVRRYDLTYYGDPEDRYVTNKRLSYPKAGTTNPTFTLKIFRTDSNTTIIIEAPISFRNIDHYFTTVTWKDNDHVLITWLNRPQNVSILTICNAVNGSCYENLRQEANSGWVDIYTSPIFTANGDHYFLILPSSHGSDFGLYNHIAMVDSLVRVETKNNDFGKKIFITSGTFDVISIEHYNHQHNTVYYIAYIAGDPTSRHLYRTTSDDRSDDFMKPVCLSCNISLDCKWVSASFSTTGDYYMLTCHGPGVPVYTLTSTLHDNTTTFVDNSNLKKSLSKVAWPKTKIFQIPSTDKQSMWVKLLLPPLLKESDSDVKYNLLLNVYGGPNSQSITQVFHSRWEHYLSSNHNIVIGYLDGRGTAGRGQTWLHSNYRHLGTTEVDDTITAARYFKSLPYVGENVAIWGWSYGGFLTSSVLGRGTDVFKCGMAVAPVTDWRYYDSIYTERFMGMPTSNDNKAAYDFANVSRYTDNFKHSQFMIAHGTGDDNVHFQNTAQLIRALTESDVYFRTQVYTDQQHSINGGNSQRHLYHTLEDFLLQCYGNPTPQDDSNTSSEKDSNDE